MYDYARENHFQAEDFPQPVEKTSISEMILESGLGVKGWVEKFRHRRLIGASNLLEG
jgi:hypothetical protein